MNQSIKWETFAEVGSRFGKKVISITANQGFGFSSGLFNELGLGRFSHVILKYAKNRGVHYIGFEFLNDPNKVGAVQLTKKGNFAQVGVRSFFQKYQLDAKQLKGAYPVEYSDDSDNRKLAFIKISAK